MNYTLNQLQVFLKIVQTGSVTKASEELHLSQPAVSIQLKNFQDQFDIPLTEVLGRKIHITDFGKEIAQVAEDILLRVETLNHRTLSYKGKLSGRLRIAIVSTGKYVMPYFLSQFLKDNPGVELHMDVTNRGRVIEALENNEVDFGLVSILPSTLQLQSIDLLPNKLFLIGSAAAEIDVLSKRGAISDLPLIYREKGSGTRLTMEKFFSEGGILVHNKMELTSNEAVKQAVIAGMGYSILPIIGLRNELKDGDLKIIPTKKLPIKSNWKLVWLNGKRHSPAASAFLQYLEKNKQQIIKNHFGWCNEY